MKILLASLAPLALVAACSPASVPAAPAREGAATARASSEPSVIVDVEEARRLVARGVTVLDVRTPAEFAAGHIPGAVNISHDELDRRAGEVGPPSTPVLLYCRSGRRSGIAARTLREKGFTELYDLKAYELWARAEAPVTAR